MSDELVHRLAVAETAARAAGEVHKRYYGSGLAAETKTSAQDLLTLADTEGQEVARAVIERDFPGERIVGEEDDVARDRLSGLLDGECWLIDPLDGTQSFVHDFPVFGPGVAFVRERRPLAGAVYLPVYEELFTAARGLGARLNGRPIGVKPPKPLLQALAGIHIREVSPPAIDRFLSTTGRILAAANGVRLLGSPMISLCYVASGRLDCFATLSPTRLGPWDHAPAVVILEEAGGVVRSQDGGAFDLMQPGIAGASNPALLDELFAAAGV
jgi:myo-inositol-1(or 4)-monophosphatase